MRLELAGTFLVAAIGERAGSRVASLGTTEAKDLVAQVQSLVKVAPTTLMAQRVLIMVGLLELVGVFFVLRGVWFANVGSVNIGVAILSILTVLWTLFFHVRPKVSVRKLLSCLAGVSALLLLAWQTTCADRA